MWNFTDINKKVSELLSNFNNKNIYSLYALELVKIMAQLQV
jgi:hypothetical protein